MSEDVNNNVVDESATTNNNYKPPRNNKSNKILLIVLIIIIIFLVGLTIYKLAIFDKKNDTPIINEDNKNEIKDNDKEEDKETENKDDNNNNKADEPIQNDDKKEPRVEVIKTGEVDGVKYEIKDEPDRYGGGSLYLYVNGVEVPGIGAKWEIEVENFKDMLLVKSTYPGPGIRIDAVNKNGEVTSLNYRRQDISAGSVSLSGSSYRIDENTIYVKELVQFSNGIFFAECQIGDTDLLASYEVKYEYLGNGKLGSGVVVNEKNIGEDLNEYCSEKGITIFEDMYNHKLCQRKNNTVKCFDTNDYESTKQKMIEMFGKENCSMEGNYFKCVNGKDGCSLGTDYFHCYIDRRWDK